MPNPAEKWKTYCADISFIFTLHLLIINFDKFVLA